MVFLNVHTIIKLLVVRETVGTVILSHSELWDLQKMTNTTEGDSRGTEDESISEEKLKSILFDNALVGLGAARGTDGKLVATNESLADIFGYASTAEFLNEFRTTDMWKKPKFRQSMYQSIQKEGHVDGFEAELLRKDGTSFWARWSGKRIPGTNLLAGAVLDISKEKEILQALREIENRYTALIESTLIGIQIIQANPLKILFSNPAACQITGYSVNELKGFSAEQIISSIHPEDQVGVSSIFSRLVEERLEGASFDIRLQTKKGEWIWVRNQASPIEYGDSPTYMVSFLDITSEIRARERAAHLQEVELYSSILIHDLGNDLQTIISFIDLAEMDIPHESPDIIRAFKSVNLAVDRMQYLLKGFKMNESGLTRSISKILRQIVEESQQKYPSLNIGLSIDKSANSVKITKFRLLPMVFEHLIRNSVQFAGESAQIWISLEARDELLEIIYSDDGPGIAEAIKPKLFRRGASIDGRGIGLNLSRKIVSGYGGLIELIDSIKGRGATFRICLPINRDF